MAQVMVEARQGLSIRGEFLSVVPARVWTGKDGVERRPYAVKLLVNDSTVKVEYRDEESAYAAIAGVADRGSVVELPVFARAKGKDWLVYSGLNLRSED